MFKLTFKSFRKINKICHKLKNLMQYIRMVILLQKQKNIYFIHNSKYSSQIRLSKHVVMIISSIRLIRNKECKKDHFFRILED